MVKKKLIEVVVCSVFLFGSCVAGMAASGGLDGRGSLDVQKENVRKEETVDDPEEMTVSGILHRMKTLQNENLTLREQYLELESKIGEARDEQEEKKLARQRKSIAQKQNLIQQEVSGLRQTLVVMKTFQKLQGDVQQESQPKDESSKRFATIYDVRDYIGVDGGIDREKLRIYVKNTYEYYVNGEEAASECPPDVPLERWRNAKVVELFSEIVKMIEIKRDPKLDSIKMLCYAKVSSVCGQDELTSDFTRAELSLMSQCRVWDDESHQYALMIDSNNGIVREAINSLWTISRERQHSKAGDAQRLLRALRGIQEFFVFFPQQ